MKKLLCILLSLLLLAGCTAAPAETTGPVQTGEVTIRLSDEGMEFPENSGVHTANDIIYYEAGHGESYGEGEDWEAHTAEEAAAHTVVHITKPGTYRLTGKLSAGQIAVDLGENAKDDPGASVILILDGLEVTCRVAPAIIFYNVYESGVANGLAGANILLADGSDNRVVGSHVAKIYEPGTEDKLHKYDGAVYSRMSMKLDGAGKLRIEADNEGLDSEMHLTVGGGEIYIESGNDGINTNADGESVTTINGGFLRIDVAGTTGEGDGIDSNGWLVINGGTVTASACGFSGDSGIDSDMGIHVNGGTVIASGNMLDRLEDGGQNYAVFTFAQTQAGGSTYTLKNAQGEAIAEYTPANDFSILVVSSPALTAGEYTFWQGETQLAASSGMGGGFGGGMMPGGQRPDGMGQMAELPADMQEGTQPAQMPENSEDMTPPELPEGMEEMTPPEGMENMTPPEGMENMERPEGGMEKGQRPEGGQGGGFGGGRGPGGQQGSGEASTTFTIADGANYFSGVTAAQ